MPRRCWEIGLRTVAILAMVGMGRAVLQRSDRVGSAVGVAGAGRTPTTAYAGAHHPAQQRHALNCTMQGRAAGIGGNPVLLGLAKSHPRVALRHSKPLDAVPAPLVTNDDRSEALLIPLPQEGAAGSTHDRLKRHMRARRAPSRAIACWVFRSPESACLTLPFWSASRSCARCPRAQAGASSSHSTGRSKRVGSSSNDEPGSISTRTMRRPPAPMLPRSSMTRARLISRPMRTPTTEPTLGTPRRCLRCVLVGLIARPTVSPGPPANDRLHMAGEHLVERYRQTVAARSKGACLAQDKTGSARKHLLLVSREVKISMGDGIAPDVQLLQPPRPHRCASVDLICGVPDVEIEAFEVRADAARTGIPPVELAVAGRRGQCDVGDSRAVHRAGYAWRANDDMIVTLPGSTDVTLAAPPMPERSTPPANDGTPG